MGKSRFTDDQIRAILGSVERGRSVVDVCREYGISEPTFYRWRASLGSTSCDTRRLKALEHENRLLKQFLVELAVDNQNLKDTLTKLAYERSS